MEKRQHNSTDLGYTTTILSVERERMIGNWFKVEYLDGALDASKIASHYPGMSRFYVRRLASGLYRTVPVQRGNRHRIDDVSDSGCRFSIFPDTYGKKKLGIRADFSDFAQYYVKSGFIRWKGHGICASPKKRARKQAVSAGCPYNPSSI